MRKLVRILLSLIGSIIALVMAHYINIFEYMSFIPSEKSFDVCITVYFTLIEMVVGTLFNYLEELIEKSKTCVEAVLYLPNEKANASAVPVVKFNNLDMADIRLRIKISGKCDNVKDAQIVIFSFKQAEMQLDRRGTGATIDNEGNIIINLRDFCHNRTEIQYQEDYKIAFQRGAVDNGVDMVLKPEIRGNIKFKKVKLLFNEANILLEEK